MVVAFKDRFGFVRRRQAPEPVRRLPQPDTHVRVVGRTDNKAMPDYSRKDFHDSFRVEELVLLKRTHPYDACKTVNIFRLLPDADAGGAKMRLALPHL